ncbi:hypothetical protein BC835DRAFT_1343386 [Cytidiella melzeri]|nr:hypothetical protein BC835DRAFT_1343386 [Cytidiella melzeri]
MDGMRTSNRYLRASPPPHPITIGSSTSLPSTLSPGASGQSSAYFQRRTFPRGYHSSESALGIDLDDTSLLMALSEPMFTTSSLTVSTIPTPVYHGDDPFVIAAEGGDQAGAPVVQVKVEENILEEQLLDSKKKKNSFLRAVKKAGASARKFASKTKSLTNRREQKLSKEDVRIIFDVITTPQNLSPWAFDSTGPDDVLEDEEELGLIALDASSDSLAATLGSPLTLSSFPISPSLKAAKRLLPPASWERKSKSPSGALNFVLKTLLKITLALPYALLVGFIPFIAPTRLSAVTFSPLFGYVSPPHSSSERHQYLMKALPCHVGLACGFTIVLNWELLHGSRLLFVVFNIVLLTIAWWMWHDYDSGSSALRGAELGVDDKATICEVFKATVPDYVRNSMCRVPLAVIQDPNVKKHRSEDSSMESVQLDITLPLNESSLDSIRIVVQCDD